MRTTITLTSLTAALLISGAAIADTQRTTSSATIETLPTSGTVSLTGTVERVVDGDSFVLRDRAGETITVHTNAQHGLKEGANVAVKGEKNSGFIGMGREIKDATVASADNKSAVKSTAESKAEAHHMASAPAPHTNQNRNAHPETTAYDVDIERHEKGVTVNAERLTQPAAVGAGVTMDKANPNYTAQLENNAQDTISNLPREGMVELSGVVEKVNNDNSFTLRDADGKTIDIQAETLPRISPGDRVSVNGNLKSKLLGMGREIERAQVMVISAAD